ncbi:MAG: aconitase family protein [Polyangia bacterium]|mgnify:FL=1
MQTSARRAMTLTQKILAAHAIGLPRPWVQAGDILRVRVDWTIASELAWNGMDKTYDALGRPPLHNPERFFLAVDHTVDPTTLRSDVRAQKLVQLSRNFAKERKLRHFYDANQTILHTKFYRDLLLPGQVVIGADSHSSSHGGLGAFAIGLGGADVTAAMVLGESWIEVPDAISVEYEGTPAFGLTGKDIILRTLGELGRNTVAMERSVEYRGSAVSSLSTDMRFTIANMTAEFGGLNGIFEPDAVTAAWLAQRTDSVDASGCHFFRADDDAPYIARHTIRLDALEPLVAKPFSPDNVVPLSQHVGMPVHGVFIGACTTTEEELVLGALVLEQALRRGIEPTGTGRRLVVPGDLSIQGRLYEAGLWRFYEQAGFQIDPPGCSMCLGVASQRAGKGETWLSSQNRNYPNRMGEGSLAWLASGPAVAAASLGMAIRDPRELIQSIDQDRFQRILHRTDSRLPEVTVSEPSVAVASEHSVGQSAAASVRSSTISGRAQRFGNHIDTDAIIPGQFCHLTDFKELGDHCFEFVRPGFAERTRAGQNIVVAEEGWGSGSSREQAVWALKGAGVAAVIAKSYAFIHKRNLVNEALPFLVISDEEFYQLTAEDDELLVDVSGTVTHVRSGKTFHAKGSTPLILALQREGGLVPAISRNGPQVFGLLTGQ